MFADLPRPPLPASAAGAALFAVALLSLGAGFLRTAPRFTRPDAFPVEPRAAGTQLSAPAQRFELAQAAADKPAPSPRQRRLRRAHGETAAPPVIAAAATGGRDASAVAAEGAADRTVTPAPSIGAGGGTDIPPGPPEAARPDAGPPAAE
jgi:hypothetical protein